MLCEKCGKNEATTYYKQNINGKVTEYRLCSECAEEVGAFKPFEPFPFDFGNLFSSVFFDDLQQISKSLPNIIRCKECGASFDDIASLGKVGCSSCYSTFFDQFEPTLRRIHSNTNHVGKIPNSAGARLSNENKIKKLREELNTAINDENFEKAAEIRDKIKELQKGE